MTKDISTEIVIIGSGPAGYSAALILAKAGKKITLIEKDYSLGGTCLNVGCIPSKTILNISDIIKNAKQAKEYGVNFEEPKIDIEKIQEWKNSIINRLNNGLNMLFKRHKIEVINSRAEFIDNNRIKTENNIITFEKAIIATGSKSKKLSFLPKHKNIITSKEALEINDIPENMLIIGAGIIGLEMANFYHTLGTKISIVEFMDQIIPGLDKDTIVPLYKQISKEYKSIILNTKVLSAEIINNNDIKISFIDNKTQNKTEKTYNKILVAVGREPNSKDIIKNINLEIDKYGFIQVDNNYQTNIKNIYAIGDVIGNPMLAHKAQNDAELLSDILLDKNRYSNNNIRAIPSIAFTDPEISWVGKNEKQLLEDKTEYSKSVFHWTASSKALLKNKRTGFTKILFDKNSKQILGASIVGLNSGELITQLTLAIQNKLTVDKIISTIFPHPSLSETIKEACTTIIWT